MSTQQQPEDEILTATKVAAMFGVDPKTVARWAKEGRLPHFKTLGGHRRYRRSEVEPLVIDLGS